MQIHTPYFELVISVRGDGNGFGLNGDLPRLARIRCGFGSELVAVTGSGRLWVFGL